MSNFVGSSILPSEMKAIISKSTSRTPFQSSVEQTAHSFLGTRLSGHFPSTIETAPTKYREKKSFFIKITVLKFIFWIILSLPTYRFLIQILTHFNRRNSGRFKVVQR